MTILKWNNGKINWSLVDGVNNVVQVNSNATISSIQVYWWRNEQPGEDLYRACQQFAMSFDFAAAGATVIPCVVQEWSPNGMQLIQERQFGFSTSDMDVFGG